MRGRTLLPLPIIDYAAQTANQASDPVAGATTTAVGGSPVRAKPSQLRGTKTQAQPLSAPQQQRHVSKEVAGPVKDAVHLLESTLGIWTRSIKAVLATDPDACLEVDCGSVVPHPCF